MSEYKRLTDKYATLSGVRNIKHETFYYRLRELEDKLEAGKLVELPFIAMIDRLMENGKFLATNKAQAFNGRYCVVRIIEDWKCPVIEICSEKSFNRVAAEARLKELEAKGK